MLAAYLRLVRHFPVLQIPVLQIQLSHIYCGYWREFRDFMIPIIYRLKGKSEVEDRG